MELPVSFDEFDERRMLVIDVADMATSREGRNGDHRNAWPCPEEINRLYLATQQTLTQWIALLREQTGDNFPEKVTAFRPEMAVHGKYGKPCPVCGKRVLRIVYAENESNYCATCQTNGKHKR